MFQHGQFCEEEVWTRKQPVTAPPQISHQVYAPALQARDRPIWRLNCNSPESSWCSWKRQKLHVLSARSSTLVSMLHGQHEDSCTWNFNSQLRAAEGPEVANKRIHYSTRNRLAERQSCIRSFVLCSSISLAYTVKQCTVICDLNKACLFFERDITLLLINRFIYKHPKSTSAAKPRQTSF